MKKKIHEGKEILYIPDREVFRGMTWVIEKSEKRIYKCDIYGTVFSIDMEGNKETLNPIEEAEGRKNPRVAIKRKKKRVDLLVATAIFRPWKVNKSRVHHFDGDTTNNAVANLYLDITPKPPSREVGDNRKGRNN